MAINRTIRYARAALLVLLLGLGSGCGKSLTGASYTDDEKAVEAVFEAVNEGDLGPKKLTPLFAANAMPDKEALRKMKTMAINIGGKPTVSGTTATVQAVFFDHSGKSLGKTEWAFVKEGERWKVTSAPLP